MSRQSPIIIEKMHHFFEAFPPVSFQPNQVVIQGEQEPNGIFFLRQGQMIQVANLVNGDRLTVNYYDSPAFLPMIWAFGQSSQIPIVNRHEFVTITEVVGCWAPVEQVMAWLETQPDVLMDLTARLCRGFDATLAKWEESHQSPATLLVGKVLLRHASRLGVHQSDGSILVKLTHQDVADQAGVTRETASRILSEFVTLKHITTGYRKIFLLDTDQLEQWLKTNLKPA